MQIAKKNKIVILDGAMGTQLQERGMPAGVCPESWCIGNHQALLDVHSDYVRAGAHIIYTCTFGANRPKLAQYGIKDVIGVNKKLTMLARKACAGKALVAGDIGPTGLFVKPFGSLSFEAAVEIFKEQVIGLLQGGADLFIIETMMDIQEARAALIAVKELSKRSVFVTMTFEKTGRTLNGNDPASALVTLQSLGADAVGCNCSTGPDSMAKIIAAMRPFAKVPLIAKPNAGIPELIKGNSRFTMKPERFAALSSQLIEAGAGILGGCCGTTPAHIAYLKACVSAFKPKRIKPRFACAVSSARQTIALEKDRFCLIGEKINPTGKKKLQEALAQNDFTLVRVFAKEQQDNGAALLDVNMGLAGGDEQSLMEKAIDILSVHATAPLVIDTSDPLVLESALRLYPGRALVNSVSLEKERMKKALPLIKKYGAACVLLPISCRKIPMTLGQRKMIIGKLLKYFIQAGVQKEDLIVDALALTISSYAFAAKEALQTIRWCSHVLNVKTVVGLSNISFGLPQRKHINSTFLALARKAGLTLAIMDPAVKQKMNAHAQAALSGMKKALDNYIKHYSCPQPGKVNPQAEKSVRELIHDAIIDADKDNIPALLAQAESAGLAPLEIMQGILIPAIIEVGDLFEKKHFFLPQLIASAEAMKQAAGILEPKLRSAQQILKKKGLVLISTVEGDIHDIGKNIVALMLENNGFEIIDLGKDVSCEKIIATIKEKKPHIVGLSALMTTTMVNMKKVITGARSENLECRFLVGGAVLNQAYAASIGAEYARDAIEAVRVATRISRHDP